MFQNKINNYRYFSNKLKFCCKEYDYFIYGKSESGQNLYAFHKGSYKNKQLLITGGMHAREYISSEIVFKLLRDYDLKIGCYFIPIVNPDGVKLSMNGINAVKNKDYKKMLLRFNNQSKNFSMWKANVRGVDLNLNFDAMWGESKYSKVVPGASGFAGEYPISEKENLNLLNFIEKKYIIMSLAYHSKGKVVYYGFEKLCKKVKKQSKNIAKFIAKNLHYKAIQSKGSTGGLSDYLYYKMKIPSFTIELGSDKLLHPIKLSESEKIYKNQYKMLKKLIKKYVK